jgi:hypothetical protein
MDDLEKLNRTIAAHWLGKLDACQEGYLAYASRCVGLLFHSASELAERLQRLRQNHEDPRRVAKLNRRYLHFARLAARDAGAGKLDMLVRLGITLSQAKVLRGLTDEDVDRLAFGWNGPIMRFSSQGFDRGTALHHQAGKHHATAFLAVHVSGKPGVK